MLIERLFVAFYGLVAIAFLVFAFGCGGSSGGAEESGALIGGGPTRRHVGNDHPADARAIAAHGGTATVLELNECVRGRQRGARGTPDEWCPNLIDTGARIRAMRAHGVTSLVNVLNANGLVEQRLDSEAFAALVTGLREEIRSTERVILSAVSEPWNAGSFEHWRHLTSIGRALWPGELAMPTRSGAGADLSPAFSEIPFDWIDYHPCSDELALAAIGTPGVIVNTDCRGMMDPGPARARPLIRRALETGGTLLFYGGPGQADLSPTLAVIGEDLGG